MYGTLQGNSPPADDSHSTEIYRYLVSSSSGFGWGVGLGGGWARGAFNIEGGRAAIHVPGIPEFERTSRRVKMRLLEIFHITSVIYIIHIIPIVSYFICNRNISHYTILQNKNTS